MSNFSERLAEQARAAKQTVNDPDKNPGTAISPPLPTSPAMPLQRLDVLKNIAAEVVGSLKSSELRVISEVSD
jgi:hypothetical protein